MPTLDPQLVVLALGQGGALTTAQAAGCGVSAPSLVALVRAGLLVHPGRGVYLVASAVPADPVGRHAQLCRAALLLYPDAVLAGVSAVLAHGLPVWGADLARPDIRRPPDRCRGVSFVRVRHGSALGVETAWGLAQRPSTALAELVVDHGIAAGVVSADAALHRGLVDTAELLSAVEAVSSWRHGSRASAMARHVDGRRESVGESRCGLALAVAGIAVDPQVDVHTPGGRFVARVDFLVRGTKVVIEFDGKVKYADGPESLWAEKRREDDLRALGYVVVRITWADLERPGAVAAKVRAGLRLAA